MFCVHKVWAAMRMPYRCGLRARFFYDGIYGPVPLCGKHANSSKRMGKTVKPIDELQPSQTAGEEK